MTDMLCTLALLAVLVVAAVYSLRIYGDETL